MDLDILLILSKDITHYFPELRFLYKYLIIYLVDCVPIHEELYVHKTQKPNEVVFYVEILQEGTQGSGVSNSIMLKKKVKKNGENRLYARDINYSFQASTLQLKALACFVLCCV